MNRARMAPPITTAIDMQMHTGFMLDVRVQGNFLYTSLK